MNDSSPRQPRRVPREDARRHPARSPKAGGDAFTVHVWWRAGPRTRAWDDLWRWLLSEAEEANDENRSHEAP